MNTTLPMRNFNTFLLLLALATGPMFAQPVPISGCSSVVTTTADSGPGSLRAALECANNHPGFDVVTFAIPGAGPHTIRPSTPLPDITEAARVDGYTQPGATPNTLRAGSDARLMIEIDGSLIAGAGNGLVVRGGNSTLRGLVINGFNINGVGILLLGTSNTVEGCFLGTDVTGALSRPNVDGVWMDGASYNQIGRAAPAARNVISGNRYGGVGIDGGILNQVQGNYIGSDASGLNRLGNGTSDGNGAGVFVSGGGSLHLIGGPNPGEGNLIADNKQSQLIIVNASRNTVQGNWIGLDRTGTRGLNAGGYYGVIIQNAEDNLIGGSGAGAGNVISANVRGINASSDTRTVIAGNRIGTDPSGKLALGNAVDGISLESGSVDALVGGTGVGSGNIIAFNGRQGVKVSGSARGGRILGNSIHDNAQLGIDLVLAAVDQEGDGPTPNDALDSDVGANDLQNFPEIASATLTGNQVVLVGLLQSQSFHTYQVEFFANRAADPSGYGEGEQWVGTANVTTDGAGYGTFIGIFPAPSGHVFYSATATDIAAGQTSEFSKAVEAMPCSNALANQPCLPVRPGAVFIPGLFNTGVNNARAPLADDSPDPHYTLVTGSPIVGTPMVATAAGGFPIPPWLADNPISAWIAPTASTYGPGATDGSAVYYYQIEFDLTGLDPSTAVITGQWSTDNYGSNILINGVSTGLSNHSQFAAWTPFVISNGFVAGMNTLTFMVNNGFLEPAPDGPTGLRVEMTGTALFASPIPGLFNTGVDAAGTPQADDASEMHYTLAWASAVAGTPTVATSSGGFPIGPWLADNSVSAWIAPSRNTEGPNATSGAANYFYQTRFDLTGRDPATAVIEGQWSTDNGGIDILINGVSTGQSNPSQFTSWTPFRISRGFVAGLNTLTFMVNNGAGDTADRGPTGLRVEMRSRALPSCVDFQTLPPMSVPNPWFYQGIWFFARDFTGGPLAFPGIRRDGVFTGLNCGWQLEMDLPSPCNSVELTLVHFSAPAIATAYDASGTVVASATMTGPQNVAQTLTLNGLGITRVVIVAPSDETLLLGLCCRRGRPGPPRHDFNDCLLPSGTSFPGAGNVGRIADDGTGRNCVVHLTDANQGGAFGVFSLPPPFGGGNVDNIHLHWRSLVGGDNGAICDAAQFDRPGADGYSMSWGTDLPNPPSLGNPGEEGAGTGLSVTVDTFDNGGGEAPGIEIKWRGQRLAFDNINADPGLAKDFLRKNTFVEADLTVDTAGQATFTYDGRVLTATLGGWSGIAGGNIMFGARTGGACDNHWIDDLLIEEGVPVTPCGRNLSVVRNGNSILITWDGEGILQSTPSLVPSSWTDVPGNPAGSYVTSTTGSAQFFRVVCSLAVLSAGGPGVSLPNPTTLLSAVPIINSGTAPAENVQVTAITLADGTLTSPAMPANLGTIPANGSTVLHVVFAGNSFVPGGSYGLTVAGTYSLAGVIYPFTLAATLVVPPAAPGEAILGTVIVEANQVAGAPFPPQPRRLGPKVNTPAWTVPNGPFVPGTPTPATGTRMAPLPDPAQAPEIAAAAGPGPIVFLANNGLGINNGSTIAEPSGASGGGVVFVSANWFAAYSTDGGNTFTQLDPTTVFPNDAVGFCCDQVVQYVPSINRFIWLLQGTGYRLATASPQDIINSRGTAWTYWNLTTSLFGQCTGFDYPDLSVGNNSLYMSWDAASSGTCRGGFQVARTSLAGLLAGGTITIEFTDPANGTMAWGSHLMQNTLDEIFWAGHNNNSQMRVFSLAEGSNRYFWRDVGVFSWANNAPTSTTPDGQDWLAKNFNGPGGNTFPRNGIIGATRSGNQLWFAWSAGTDRNFQQAHVEMVTLDRGNNFRLTQQVQIWNNSYAFAYPCLATDACSGEVGLSLEYGGNGNYENHVVGFWGDFLVYLTSASNVGTTRYGDYVTLRQAPATQANPGNLFTAFGYGLNSVPPPGTGTTTDIRYVLFGRPAFWCISIP